MHTPKNTAVRKSTTPRLRPRICSAMILAAGLTTQVYGATVTFQNGVGGYTGYKVSRIAPATPDTPNGTGLFQPDGSPLAQALFMFDNLFNDDGGPIPSVRRSIPPRWSRTSKTPAPVHLPCIE